MGGLIQANDSIKLTPARTAWFLALLFFAALAVRIGNIHFTSQGAQEIHDDSVDYHLFAVNLLDQGTYVDGKGEFATRMPGYSLFLATIYKVFGQSVLAVQMVQSLLNALACLFIFFAVRKMVSENWAFVAGGLAVFYFDFFTGSARILSESLYVFFLTLFILYAVQNKKTDPVRGVVAGILNGLCILIRPEAILLGLGIGFFIAQGPWRKKMLFLACFWMGLAAPLMPWVIRNYQVLDAFVPLTTRAGASAYVGLQLHMNRRGLIEEEFTQLSPSEVEDGRLHFEKAKSFYKNISFSLLLKSMAYNVSVFFYPFHPFLDPTMLWVLPFWLYGLFRVIKQKREHIFLAAYLLLLMFSYTFFGATAARYREPLSPGVILTAGLGLKFLFDRCGQKKFFYGIFTWVLVVGILFFQAGNIRSMILSVRDRIW